MAKKLAFILEVEGGNKLVKTLADTKRNLSSITKEITLTNKKIKEYEKLGKQTTSLKENLIKLTAEQIQLRETSKRTNQEIRNQARLFDDLGNKIPKDSLPGLRNQYGKLTKEIGLMSNALLSSEKGIAKIAKADKLKRQIDKRGEAVKDFRSQVGSYKVSVVSALRDISRGGGLKKLFGVGLPAGALGGVGIAGIGRGLKQIVGVTSAIFLLRAGLRSTVNIVKDFESSQAVLNSILNETDAIMETLSKESLRYGAITAFTASQVTGLQTNLARLGFSESEIRGSTGGIIDFSIALKAEVPEAAKLAGAALRGFQLDAKEMDRVVSVLGVVTTKSALDFKKLETALPKVAAVASIAGDSIETVAAKMGILSDRGIESSIIGTSLRNIYIKLANKGLTWADAMEQIRTAQDKTTKATELFDVRAAASALILAENEEKTLALEESLKGVNEELRIMAQKQLDTVEGKLKLLTSAWQGLVLSFDTGEGVLSNTMNVFIEGATALLGYFTELNQIDTATAIINHRNELENLLNVLAKNKGNLGIQEQIIDDLNQKYPEYLENINLETIGLQGVVDVLRDYDTVNKFRLEDAIREQKKNVLLKEQAGLQQKIIDLSILAEQKQKTADETVNVITLFGSTINAESAKAAAKLYQDELDKVNESLKGFEENANRIGRGGAFRWDTKGIEVQRETIKDLRKEQGELRETIISLSIAGGDYNEKLIQYNEITTRINSLTSIFNTDKKNVKLAADILKDKLAAIDNEQGLIRALNIAAANKTIQDATLLAKEIEKIELQSTIDTNAKKISILKDGLEKQNVVNEQFKNEKDLAKINVELNFLRGDKLIKEIQAAAIEEAKIRATSEEDLQGRLQEIKIRSNITSIGNQLKNEDLTNQERLKLETDLQNKVKELRLAGARVETGFFDTIENINEEELEAKVLLLNGIIPDFDNIADLSLKSIKEYEEAKKIIRLETLISGKEAEREVLILAGEDTHALDIEIGEKKIELHKSVNAKILSEEAKRIATEEKLRKDALLAQQKALEGVGAAFGNFFATVGEDSEKAGKQLLKSIGSVILDLIGKQLELLTISSFSQPDSVATFGATGAARLALITGLIKGAVGGLKSLIGNFEGGDYLDGAVFKGKDHGQGGTKFRIGNSIGEAQRGEAIIKRESTQKNKGLLSAINVSGGGKSFDSNTGYWTKILNSLGTHEHGGILGNRLASVNVNQNVPIVVVSSIKSDDMDVFAEKVSEKQIETLTPIVESIVNNVIVGLDETNRLKDRGQAAELKGLV